jgi:hypothetical protein
MSVLGSVTDLMNASAVLQRKEAAATERKPGGEMGKHDFLLLLSAQLRFQDPLNPQSDSDFAAGLAQFSSLEQMQNMNSTLEAMAFNQSFSLVGQFVIAETLIDGRVTEIPGVVDSIFVKNGVTFAQIGEYVIPVSSIKEVFDTQNILTSEMLMQTSSNLIGRTVVAEIDGKDIEGVVTRILVDKGALIAQINTGHGEPQFVPVNSIVDIRETGTNKHTPKPEHPPDAINWKSDGNGNFIELCEDGIEELGLWTWDEAKWEWVFESFANVEDGEQQAA